MAESKVAPQRVHVLKSALKFHEDYSINDRFIPAQGTEDIHTTIEMVEHLKKHPEVDIEAKVLVRENGSKKLKLKDMDRIEFLSKFDEGAKHKNRDVAHILEGDWARDQGGGNLNLIGHDYVPLLSGPFYKQLYYYDYLRMHALAFHEYHHDVSAKRAIDMIVHFTLGRGYKVDFENKAALALWDSFSKVNSLPRRFEYIAQELMIFGEQFLWWLPGNESYIAYNVAPGQQPAKGILPRIRQIDPSVLWEIVTYPEDIERVLYYQWVAPTQYQLYTGMDKGSPVPGLKFIWQQIPAEQVDHFKFNCVSNEKRGRSILFPVFGDLKRLRDTIAYSIASMQKNAAWSIDTTVEGSQEDVDAYAESQKNIGTIPEAASEFIHTKAITRNYLGNNASGAKAGSNNTFDWVMSRIAMGVGIPVTYFGTHLSGGSTRASAIVATEPVAKLFEYVQNYYERILRRMGERLLTQFGLDIEKCGMEITFPEIITQDRSAKLKDICLAQSQGWISKDRAATMAAKELNITNYNFETEQKNIDDEALTNEPLTMPPQNPDEEEKSDSAVTGDEKRDLDKSRGF